MWTRAAGQQREGGACERCLRGGISLAWWLIGYRGLGRGNRFLAQACRWKVGGPGLRSLASRSGIGVPQVNSLMPPHWLGHINECRVSAVSYGIGKSLNSPALEWITTAWVGMKGAPKFPFLLHPASPAPLHLQDIHCLHLPVSLCFPSCLSKSCLGVKFRLLQEDFSDPWLSPARSPLKSAPPWG